MIRCYLNGNYLPLQEAKISVMDRGFLFGDGVYEVIPVLHQYPLAFQEHMLRLNQSLSAIGMENPLSFSEWQTILEQLIAESQGQNVSVYVQVTRGAYEIRNHQVPDDVKPTVFVAAFPLTWPSPLHQGIKVVTTEDHRWSNCHIKAITLLPNVLAKYQAKQAGKLDAILVRDGYPIEGTSSNLFIVKNGHVFTPPLTANILHGITRSLVLGMLKDLGISYTETMITIDALYGADEVWFTNSTAGIIPVIEIDGRPVSDGKPGPQWRLVFQHYEKRS